MNSHQELLESLWQANETTIPKILYNYQRSLEPYVYIKHFLTIPLLLITTICLVLTLIVLSRGGFWGSAVSCIVVLAIVDLFTMCFLCTLMLDYLFLPLIGQRVYVSFETVMSEVVDTLLFMSNWLTTLLAIDRFCAIGRPHSTWRICGKRGYFIICILLLLCIFIKIPGFTFHKLTDEKHVFRITYVWIVQVLLFLIVPFVLLTFINVRLIIAVRVTFESMIKADQRRSQQSLMAEERTARPTSSSNTDSYRNDHRDDQIVEVRQSEEDTNHLKIVNSNSTISQNSAQRNIYASANSNRESLSTYARRSAKEERKLTLTLICLLITFIVFQGPFEFVTVLTRFSTLSKNQTFLNLEEVISTTKNQSITGQNKLALTIPLKTYLNPISVIAYALKSDLYFLFYCWFCGKFLKTLKTLFRCKHLAQFCCCLEQDVSIGSQKLRIYMNHPQSTRQTYRHPFNRDDQKGILILPEGKAYLIDLEPNVWCCYPSHRPQRLNLEINGHSGPFDNSDAQSISLPPNCYYSHRRIVVDRKRSLKVKFLSPIR